MLSDTVGRVVRFLEEKIASGSYPGGSRLPSERTLSDELDVSRITVRLAIRDLVTRGLAKQDPNHSPVVVSASEREKIAASPVPSPLSSVSRRTVVFISYHGLNNADLMALYQGAHAALAVEKFRLTLSVVGNREDKAAVVEAERNELLMAAADPEIAGVILWHSGGDRDRDAIETLMATGKPVIFIDRMPPSGIRADYVGVDNRGAAAAVVRHLLELGYSRILHLTYAEERSTILQRREGWRLALREAGIVPQPNWVVPVISRSGPDGVVYQEPALGPLLREWAEDGGDTSAIFALNDTLALLAYRAARAESLRVPEDIAIAGFDGSASRLDTRFFRTDEDIARLTSAEQPLGEIGREAAYLLIERLIASECGEPDDRPRHLLLRAPLIVRASTLGARMSAAK